MGIGEYTYEEVRVVPNQRSTEWCDLPNVAVERIWNFLNQNLESGEVADLRLVCKQWKQSISLAIEELTVDLTTDQAYYKVLPGLKRIVFAGPFNQKTASEGTICRLQILLQGLEYCKCLRELDISSVPLQFELANTDSADIIDNTEVVRVLPKLTALTQLKLPSKIPKTFGGVAEALGHLRELKKVSFPRSKLRRLAIDSILACRNADSLKLQAHSRKVLRRIAQLRQLKELTLYSLSKDVGEEAFADCLKNLKMLELLRIDFSDQFRLTQTGVLALAMLTNLRQLHLNGLDTAELDNHLDNMQQLSELTGLTHLELSALGNVRSSLAAFLPGLPCLVSLSISLVHPESWHMLLPSTLTALWLSHDQHLDDLLPFQGLTALRHLSITCCTHVEDAALKKLSTLTNLEKLQVVETKITGKAFQHFQQMPHLSHLALGPCITSKGFQAAAQVAPNLKLLKLVDCWDLDKLEGVQRLSKLTRLELMRCNVLQDNHLRKNLPALSELQVLLMHGGTCIKSRVMSGDWLRALSALPNLKHFEVNSFVGGMADNFQGLPKITKFSGSQKITRISLRSAIKMNDDGLAPLASLSHCLAYLDLSGCSSIKGRGLSHLSYLQKLKHLDLSLCDGLGKEAARVLCGEPSQDSRNWGPMEFIFGALSTAKAILSSLVQSSKQPQPCQNCGKYHSGTAACLCSGYESMGVHHDLPHFDQEMGSAENQLQRSNIPSPRYPMLCGKPFTDDDYGNQISLTDEKYEQENIKVLPSLSFLAFKRSPTSVNSHTPDFSCLTRLKKLEYVDLDYQPLVNDELIKSFSKQLTQLSHLSVRQCKSLTRAAEDHLRKFRNLRELKVTETELTKRDGLERLERMLRQTVVHVQ